MLLNGNHFKKTAVHHFGKKRVLNDHIITSERVAQGADRAGEGGWPGAVHPGGE